MHLSVILPCYNNGPQAISAAWRVQRFLESQDLDFEIILVDDGSHAEARPQGRNLPSQARLITYPQNRGKGYALRQGMLGAYGEIRIFTDSDLPYDLSAIISMYNALKAGDASIVAGDRRAPNSVDETEGSWLRHLASFVMIHGMNRLLIGRAIDTQCGIKGFNAAAAGAFFRRTQIDGFAIDLEIWLLALTFKVPIQMMPVRLVNQGKSSVRVVRHSLHMLRDALKVRWHLLMGHYEAIDIRTLNFKQEKIAAWEDRTSA